jgi:hypothetical protein
MGHFRRLDGLSVVATDDPLRFGGPGGVGLLVMLGDALSQGTEGAAKLPPFHRRPEGRVQQPGCLPLAGGQCPAGLTLQAFEQLVLASGRLKRGEQLAHLSDEPLGSAQVQRPLLPLDPIGHSIIRSQPLPLMRFPTGHDRPLAGQSVALGLETPSYPLESGPLFFVNRLRFFRNGLSLGGSFHPLLGPFPGPRNHAVPVLHRLPTRPVTSATVVLPFSHGLTHDHRLLALSLTRRVPRTVNRVPSPLNLPVAQPNSDAKN